MMAMAVMRREDESDGSVAVPPPSHALKTERATTFASLADSALALSMGYLCSADQARAASASRGLSRAAVAAEAVGLSIVMPIFNALQVGLPIAVRDILAQTTFGPAVCPTFELCAADDGSTDGGREWLLALCDALGRRGFVADGFAAGAKRSSGGGESTDGGGADAPEDDEHNLGGRQTAVEGARHATARGQVQGDGDGGSCGGGGDGNGDGSGTSTPAPPAAASSGSGIMPVMPAADVAACISPRFRRLRLISTQAGTRGQGAAMNAALAAATGSIIGLMESDDERPPHTFGVLCTALTLGAQEEARGRPQGQNKARRKGGGKGKGQWKGSGEVDDAGEAAAGEAARADAPPTTTPPPAAVLTKYDAVCSQVELICTLPDGTTGRLNGNEFGGMQRYIAWQNGVASSREIARERFVEIPALHQACVYWRRDIVALGGYEANPAWPVDMDFWMRWVGAGRRTLKLQEPLYMWRQHEGQGTRNSGRCSIENLRRCKVHHLVDKPGPCHGRHVQIWSVGMTLTEYGEALRLSGKVASVAMVPWDTKQHNGRNGRPPPSEAPLFDANTGDRYVRLFIYGAEKARRRVLAMIKDYDEDHDWFAA